VKSRYYHDSCLGFVVPTFVSLVIIDEKLQNIWTLWLFPLVGIARRVLLYMPFTCTMVQDLTPDKKSFSRSGVVIALPKKKLIFVR